MMQCSVCASCFVTKEDSTTYGCINCKLGNWQSKLTYKKNTHGNNIKGWYFTESKQWGFLSDLEYISLKLKCLQKRILGKYNSELWKELGMSEPYQPRTPPISGSENVIQD